MTYEEDLGFYLIGKSEYEFIKINRDKTTNNIYTVLYDIEEFDASIFHSYHLAELILNEIKERMTDIKFRSDSVQNVLNRQYGFDYKSYVDSLKIYKMVPQLVEPTE